MAAEDGTDSRHPSDGKVGRKAEEMQEVVALPAAATLLALRYWRETLIENEQLRSEIRRLRADG